MKKRDGYWKFNLSLVSFLREKNDQKDVSELLRSYHRAKYFKYFTSK